MSWMRIRLTLARTPEHPEGSWEHAYELDLPLLPDGTIDRAAFSSAPGRATVQRLVPNAGVQRGAIVHKRRGWAFSYEPGDADDEDVFHLENHPLTEGSYVTLTEPDGEQLPFQVATVRPLPAPVSQ